MLPVMKTASKVNGIMFIVMLAGMFVYSLPAVFTFARNQTQSLDMFFDGELLRKFETFYDKQLFLRDASVQQWANVQYLLFDESNTGAVFGRDGWLFSNQEYLVPNDLVGNMDDQLAQIANVRETLEASGKQLIVLPVPMKLDIQRSQALDQPTRQILGLHDDFVSRLQGQRVAVSSVRPAFLAAVGEQDMFLRNDTHWNPDGARLAAVELARQYPELIGDRHYTSSVSGNKSVKGDLVNFLNFDPRLKPRYFAPVDIKLYETLDSEQSTAADALFGEVPQNLMLVGTSYSRIDDWNFVGFLKEALHSDILSIAVEAKGPFQAMDEFLASEELKDPGITTVIWEFPVRTLLAQRTTWRMKNQQNTTHF